MPLLPSGSDAAAPHLTWDGTPFKTGEATFFELVGLLPPLPRAVLPHASSWARRPDMLTAAEAALVEGLEAGLEAARAGNRACDVANALAAPTGARRDRPRRALRLSRSACPIRPTGASARSRCAPRTRPSWNPGMTFHFMPGLWMDDWGLEITESILIREDGPGRVPLPPAPEAVREDEMATLEDTAAILGDLVAFPTVSTD